MVGTSILRGTPHLLVTLLVICTDGGRSTHERLNEFIHHYESLSYSTRQIYNSHIRHKRSQPDSNEHVEVVFHAHGRPFKLQLKLDHSIFHKDYHVEGPAGVSLSHLDFSHYHGVVAGEPGSHVYGSIRDGVFDGTIHTERDGTFYVERVHRYLSPLPPSSSSPSSISSPTATTSSSASSASNNTSKATAHSVIYRDMHVSLPAGLPIGGCAHEATLGVKDWMEAVQSSAVVDDLAKTEPHLLPEPQPQVQQEPQATAQRLKQSMNSFDPQNDPSPQFKWTASANRAKRKARKPPPTNKKSCSLFIKTDPLLWNHIWQQERLRLQEEPKSVVDAKTQEEILSLIAQHVKAVNKIYGDTEFDAGKYSHTGHTFEVQRIKIYNSSDCTGTQRNETNPFCLSNIDVSNFLNLHSKDNHQHFCLAYVFTYRDFTGGTLGLAWVASASGASGGICEKYKTYADNINGINHKTKRSLNTGIITFVNYNSRVPPKVSQLTLAHEIGHNFGSPHDYPQSCRPGGGDGNYIMFASATSGDRDNNNKFSHCSIQNISAVLDAVVDDRKTNCLEESNGAFCGNKIVEEGEECDCGFDENECSEQCCHPRMNSSLSEAENKMNRCKRKPGVQCSPSEGKCCTDTCRFVPASQSLLCQNTRECTEASYCKGDQATCPKPSNKIDNETECNEGTKVCQGGECKGSICLKYGMDQCFLSSVNDHSTRDLCELACMTRGGNKTCKSTNEWAKTGQIPGLKTGMTLRPGSPCDNFQGYCDVFYKCRQVDAEGPLARLKNLLFNQKTLLTIAEWVTTFWYAVLLMGMGFVIFMALFIKCFAAHTPSSNPKMPKNKHITETLRRPMSTLRRKRYQQAPGGVPPNSSRGVPPPSSSNSRGVPPSNNWGAQPPPSSRGAPPPYPGAPQGGPGHGYGEGRGHYNRNRGGRTSPDGRSGSGSGDGRAGRAANRTSWAPSTGNGGVGNRSSKIEMNQMPR